MFANLQDFLSPPEPKKPMYSLNVGCGTGATAVRLARLGFHVTQLDSSQAMLAIARRTAEEVGITNRVTVRHDDAAQLTNWFRAASFDAVLCHNILEYVDDPTTVLRSAARILRDTSAILSLCEIRRVGFSRLPSRRPTWRLPKPISPLSRDLSRCTEAECASLTQLTFTPC